MLQLTVVRRYIWTDEELDLKFEWDDCCPWIEVSYLGDCADTSIDTISIPDPVFNPGVDSGVARAAIDDWIKTHPSPE